MGLSANKRLDDYIAVSPFNYKENCLLYIPDDMLKAQMGSEKEAKCLAEQICRLVKATHGHTLVLFTSYSLMGTVYTDTNWMRKGHSLYNRKKLKLFKEYLATSSPEWEYRKSLQNCKKNIFQS